MYKQMLRCTISMYLYFIKQNRKIAANENKGIFHCFCRKIQSEQLRENTKRLLNVSRVMRQYRPESYSTAFKELA